MQRRLHGETVALTVKTQTGTDALGCPTYTEEQVLVDNVLIAPVTGQEAIDTLNLTGRRAVYWLAIPKGDSHIWEDTTVSFGGHTWRTIGTPVEGIEDMVPLAWNRKVQVERYAV
jgi:hypothetical protein